MDRFQSLAGRMLVAMPGIGDPRFEYAVILVCVHEAGHAMGLRLNGPAPEVDLANVLVKLDLPIAEEAATRPVRIGGPVEPERGFVLHSDDWICPGTSLAFAEGLALSATRDALLAMTDTVMGPRLSSLHLGYAGWGEGQLEEELGENVWLTVEPDLDIIFDDDHETKWSRALKGLGVEAAWLSSQSGRA